MTIKSKKGDTVRVRNGTYREAVSIRGVGPAVFRLKGGVVERVPVDQFVDEAPQVRTEGDVTIIPVLEERYVLEKRLVLVEELHIRRERQWSNNAAQLIEFHQRLASAIDQRLASAT